MNFFLLLLLSLKISNLISYISHSALPLSFQKLNCLVYPPKWYRCYSMLCFYLHYSIHFSMVFCMIEYRTTKTCMWIGQRSRWARRRSVWGNCTLVGIEFERCEQIRSKIESITRNHNFLSELYIFSKMLSKINRNFKNSYVRIC